LEALFIECYCYGGKRCKWIDLVVTTLKPQLYSVEVSTSSSCPFGATGNAQVGAFLLTNIVNVEMFIYVLKIHQLSVPSK
jgi:hypothetical protein